MLDLIFTEEQLPVSFRWREPLSDEHLLELSRLNRPLRFERNREGEITVMTPVGGTGSLNEMAVSGALYVWNAQMKTGKAFAPNIGFKLPDGSCLAPDAAWVRSEVWDGLSKAEREGLPRLCPEFLIEVRTPGDSRKALETKMQRWMENGAKLAWLVDPVAGEVVVYRPGEVQETLEKPDQVWGHGPVEGFVLNAVELWFEP